MHISFIFVSSQLGEITRQRDDAEMLIPSLKAKIALLKKACREKDETATRYVEELKHVKHEIGTSGTAPKGRNYEASQPVSHCFEFSKNASNASICSKSFKRRV